MEAATQPTQHAQYQPETVVSLLEDRKMLQSARRFRECYEHANFADRRRQRRQGCERAAEALSGPEPACWIRVARTCCWSVGSRRASWSGWCL
jgi:hypothetical protein